MPENDGKIIHSVAKAITLLDILTHRAQPVALTELYRETGWPKSTIHGLLSTMRASGLIEQGADGRYWLGIRLFEYGCAVSNSWNISTIARPYMRGKRRIQARASLRLRADPQRLRRGRICVRDRRDVPAGPERRFPARDPACNRGSGEIFRRHRLSRMMRVCAVARAAFSGKRGTAA